MKWMSFKVSMAPNIFGDLYFIEEFLKVKGVLLSVGDY